MPTAKQKAAAKKKKATAKKKQPAKKKTTALAKRGATDVSTDVVEFMDQDQGAGFENVTSDDLAMPFLNILQDLSPQVKPQHEKYIEGAEASMIFNSATGQLYPESVLVIPLFYDMRFVEWVPRDNGGGFVGSYDRNDPIVAQCPFEEQVSRNGRKGRVTPEGNDLVDTATFFVLLVDESGGQNHQPAIIAMKATQLKKARQWNTMMQARKVTRRDGSKFTPPMYGAMYRLSCQYEDNDQGSWYGWVIEPEDMVSDADTYAIVKGFATTLAGADRGTMDYSAAKAAESDEVDDGGGSF